MHGTRSQTKKDKTSSNQDTPPVHTTRTPRGATATKGQKNLVKSAPLAVRPRILNTQPHRELPTFVRFPPPRYHPAPLAINEQLAQQNWLIVDPNNDNINMAEQQPPPPAHLPNEQPAAPAQQEGQINNNVHLNMQALASIKPNQFDGKTVIAEPFLRSVQRYFVAANLPEEQRQLIFPLFLTGTAESWYSQLPLQTKNDYAALLEAFRQQYITAPHLVMLRQMKIYNSPQQVHQTVDDYLNEVLPLLRGMNIPENHMITLICQNLQPPLRAMAIQNMPYQNLQEFLARLRSYEMSLQATYSNKSTVGLVAAVSPADDDVRFNNLERQIQELTRKMNDTLVGTMNEPRNLGKSERGRQWQPRQRPNVQFDRPITPYRNQMRPRFNNQVRSFSAPRNRQSPGRPFQQDRFPQRQDTRRPSFPPNDNSFRFRRDNFRPVQNYNNYRPRVPPLMATRQRPYSPRPLN